MKARSTHKALNNTEQLEAIKRNAIKEWATLEYNKIKEKHEAQLSARFSLLYSIALMQTLDEYLEFGEKRRNNFKVEMAKRTNALCEFLIGNTCTDGIDGNTRYDAEFNHSKLEQFADYYNLQYDSKELWENIR